MVVLGHAVDDGAGGACSQTHDVLVAVDARHHDVEQVAHDAGGVAERLVAAKLDGAGAVELCVAAEVGHRGLEREARAGGDLLEDHAQALVAQQMRVVTILLDGGLHGHGELLDGEDLLLGEVDGLDIVFGHAHGGSLLLAPDVRQGSNTYIASVPCVA